MLKKNRYLGKRIYKDKAGNSNNLSNRKGFVTTLLLLSVTLLFCQVSRADGYVIEKEEKQIDRKGAYWRISGGISAVNNKGKKDFKHKPAGLIGIGYDFNDVFRGDISVSYRKVSVKKSSSLSDMKNAENISVMINNYINLTDSKDGFIPYVKVGVGYGINKMKGFSNAAGGSSTSLLGKRTGNLVWQAGVGGVIQLSKNTGIDLSYHYIDLGGFKGRKTLRNTAGETTNNIKLKKVSSHEFMVGVIVRF